MQAINDNVGLNLSELCPVLPAVFEETGENGAWWMEESMAPGRPVDHAGSTFPATVDLFPSVSRSCRFAGVPQASPEDRS